ncbi:MAG: hypothetical protein GC189_13825 [Alphaproteobacteria bacterium]|nr:hypothetical protein [Alphaproteobacteria bacterium]
MLAYALAGAAIVVAAFLLRAFGVVGRFGEIMRDSRSGFAALSDAALDDDAKERAAQQASVRLFQHFLIVTLSAAAALAAPLAALWALDAVGAISLARVLGVLASWPFLIGALAVTVAVFLIKGPKRA